MKYQSPFWSEFSTGETTLALHSASEQNPPGKAQIGLGVDGIQVFYDEMSAKGVSFTQPPAKEAGAQLARFLSLGGTEISVSSG